MTASRAQRHAKYDRYENAFPQCIMHFMQRPHYSVSFPLHQLQSFILGLTHCLLSHSQVTRLKSTLYSPILAADNAIFRDTDAPKHYIAAILDITPMTLLFTYERSLSKEPLLRRASSSSAIDSRSFY